MNKRNQRAWESLQRGAMDWQKLVVIILIAGWAFLAYSAAGVWLLSSAGTELPGVSLLAGDFVTAKAQTGDEGAALASVPSAPGAGKSAGGEAGAPVKPLSNKESEDRLNFLSAVVDADRILTYGIKNADDRVRAEKALKMLEEVGPKMPDPSHKTSAERAAKSLRAKLGMGAKPVEAPANAPAAVVPPAKAKTPGTAEKPVPRKGTPK